MNVPTNEEQQEALKLDFLQWWHDAGEPDLRAQGIAEDRIHQAAFELCFLAWVKAHTIATRKL